MQTKGINTIDSGDSLIEHIKYQLNFSLDDEVSKRIKFLSATDESHGKAIIKETISNLDDDIRHVYLTANQTKSRSSSALSDTLSAVDGYLLDNSIPGYRLLIIDDAGSLTIELYQKLTQLLRRDINGKIQILLIAIVNASNIGGKQGHISGQHDYFNLKDGRNITNFSNANNPNNQYVSNKRIDSSMREQVKERDNNERPDSHYLIDATQHLSWKNKSRTLTNVSGTTDKKALVLVDSVIERNQDIAELNKLYLPNDHKKIFAGEKITFDANTIKGEESSLHKNKTTKNIYKLIAIFTVAAILLSGYVNSNLLIKNRNYLPDTLKNYIYAIQNVSHNIFLNVETKIRSIMSVEPNYQIKLDAAVLESYLIDNGFPKIKSLDYSSHVYIDMLASLATSARVTIKPAFQTNDSQLPLQPIAHQDNGVITLLNKAETQVKSYKLTTPKDDNAYNTYKRALAEEPENIRAIEGIKNIVNIYRRLGDDAENKKQKNTALLYYKRGLSINSNDNDLLKKIKLIENIDSHAGKTQNPIINNDYIL